MVQCESAESGGSYIASEVQQALDSVTYNACGAQMQDLELGDQFADLSAIKDTFQT